MKNSDGLLHFLLDEIALRGHEGATIHDFKQLVDSYFAQNQGTTRDDVDRNEIGLPSIVPKTDGAFHAQAWKWLSRNPDVKVGRDGRHSHLSLREVELLNEHTILPSVGLLTTEIGPDKTKRKDSSANQKDSLPVKIFASEQQIWLALAGHAPDNRRIFPFEFTLLSIIASRREEGIKQPELTRVSGQDKRTVPKRTEKLRDAGYIVKSRIISNGIRTSLLVLKRFAQPNSDDGPRVYSDQDDTAPAYISMSRSQETNLIRQLMHFLKLSGTMVWDQVKEKLDISKKPTESKFLAAIVKELEYRGHVQRVKVQAKPGEEVGTLVRCVQYLQAIPYPDIRDAIDIVDPMSQRRTQLKRARLVDKEKRTNSTNHGNSPGTVAEPLNIADFRQVQASSTSNRSIAGPLWDPNRLLVHTIRDAVEKCGTEGVPSIAISDDTAGTFYRRPIEQQLCRLGDFWQISQPSHLKHLALIKDTTQNKSNTLYVYYTYEKFQELVDQGHTTWEAVETIPSAAASEGQLDNYGFPILQSSLFCGYSNHASIKGCISSGQVVLPEHKLDVKAAKNNVSSNTKASAKRSKQGTKSAKPKDQSSKKSAPMLPSRKTLGRPRKFPRQGLPENADELSDKEMLKIHKSQARAKLYEHKKQLAANVSSNMESGQVISTLQNKKEIAGRTTLFVRSIANKPPQLHASADSINPSANGSGIGIVAPYSPIGYCPSILAHCSPLTRTIGRTSSVPERDQHSHQHMAQLRTHDPSGSVGDVSLSLPSTLSKRRPSLRASPSTFPVIVEETISQHKPRPLTRATLSEVANGKPTRSMKFGFPLLTYDEQTSEIDRPCAGAFVGALCTLRKVVPRGRPPQSRLAIFKSARLHKVMVGSEKGQKSPGEKDQIEPLSDKPVLAAPGLSLGGITVDPQFIDSGQTSGDTRPRSDLHLRTLSVVRSEDACRNSSSPKLSAGRKRRPSFTNDPLRLPNAKRFHATTDSGPVASSSDVTATVLDSTQQKRDQPTGPPGEKTIQGQTQTADLVTDTVPFEEVDRSGSPRLPSMTSAAVLQGPLNHEQTSLTEKDQRLAGHGFVGSLAAKRRSIMLSVVEEAGGVFPGDQELWYPFATIWMEKHDNMRPDRRTVRNAKEDLVSKRMLRQYTFTCKTKTGEVTVRNIVTLPHIDPEDPKIKDLQRKLTDCGSKLYLPDGTVVAPSILKYGAPKPGLGQRSRGLVQTEKTSPRKRGRKPSPVLSQETSSNPQDDQQSYHNQDLHIENIPGPIDANGLQRTGNAVIPGAEQSRSFSELSQTSKEAQVTTYKQAHKPPSISTESPSAPFQNSIPSQEPKSAQLSTPLNHSYQGHLDTTLVSDGSAMQSGSNVISSRSVVNRQYPQAPPPANTILDHVTVGTPGFPASLALQSNINNNISVRSDEEQTIPQAQNMPVQYLQATQATPITSQHDQVFSQPRNQDGELAEQSERSIPDTRSAQVFPTSFGEPQRRQHENGDDDLDDEKVDEAGEATIDGQSTDEPLTKRVRADGQEQDNFLIPMELLASHTTKSSNPRNRRYIQDVSKPRRLTSLLERSRLSRIAQQTTQGMSHKKIRHRGPQTGRLYGERGRRIFVAVLIAKIVCGGLEKKTNWNVVAKMLAPELAIDHVRRTWNGVRELHKNIADRMEIEFRDLFVQAYEDGIIAPIDFENIDRFDWKWLHTWSLDKLKVSSHSHIDLPATRSALDDSYSLRDTNRRDQIDYFELSSRSTVPRRHFLLHRNPWTTPLAREKRENNSHDLVSVASNWIRANVITPEASYDSQAARRKLLTLDEEAMHRGLKELLSSKILAQENRGRLAPGRTYDISDFYLNRMKAGIDVAHFKEAASFKLDLDMRFDLGESVFLSENAQDGHVMAIVNLASARQIKLIQHDVPNNRFGLIDSGYITRQMDRARFSFNIELVATETYQHGNPLLPYPDPPRCVTCVSASGQDLTKFPVWYDINGELVKVMWDLALAAVVAILAQRPGLTVPLMKETFRAAFATFELELLLGWLVDAGIGIWCDEDQSGVRLDDWWWQCLGSEDKEKGEKEHVED